MRICELADDAQSEDQVKTSEMVVAVMMHVAFDVKVKANRSSLVTPFSY